MALEGDLLTSLTGDTTLMAALTGGVHSDTHISRQYTPTAFDANGELLPCALLRMAADVPAPPHGRGSRQMVDVYLYQRTGYDAIRTARDRIFDLWHEKKIGAQTWQIFHTDDANDQEDDALGCSLIVTRFVVVRLK